MGEAVNRDQLQDERDRKHAEREENRHRARTYKDRPIQRKEQPPKKDEE